MKILQTSPNLVFAPHCLHLSCYVLNIKFPCTIKENIFNMLPFDKRQPVKNAMPFECRALLQIFLFSATPFVTLLARNYSIPEPFDTFLSTNLSPIDQKGYSVTIFFPRPYTGSASYIQALDLTAFKPSIYVDFCKR